MTNNKQQTAVEWLEMEIKKFNTVITREYMLSLCQQAKEMEKERMIEFADNYVDNCVIPNDNMAIPTIMDVPNYYEQTFGGVEQ
jgi:hypothetical protein